jgi:hypothetical protein
MTNLRKVARRLRDQVALEEIAPQLDEAVAFRDRLDAFSDHQRADVVAELAQRSDRSLLERV